MLLYDQYYNVKQDAGFITAKEGLPWNGKYSNIKFAKDNILRPCFSSTDAMRR